MKVPESESHPALPVITEAEFEAEVRRGRLRILTGISCQLKAMGVLGPRLTDAEYDGLIAAQDGIMLFELALREAGR